MPGKRKWDIVKEEAVARAKVKVALGIRLRLRLRPRLSKAK